MQKHAMALGYFFLAVFCIFTSSQVVFIEFRILLLLAALLAALAGFAFLIGACAVQLQSLRKWLVDMFWQAQQPPAHQSRFPDEHTA